MISYQEALNLIDANTVPLPPETIGLDDILGRALALPLISSLDMPQFDNSSVDGFAVLFEDTTHASETAPVTLKLIGNIPAGEFPDLNVAKGEAVRIFTGAPVPRGANAVIMQESCRSSNGSVHVLAPVNKQENIRKAGGEFSKGDEILPAGVVVTPPVVGLFAALGMSEFSVGRLPSVALIIIGNELVRPGQALSAGQIYDSNSAGLMSAAKALGLKNITSFFVKDDPDLLQEACLKALASVDILICSGGVSVGDHDFVKPVLKQIGIRTVFWQVAIKPGRPIYFGTFDSANGNKLVFGLPGNTVSTLVTFHQFVKRAILKMMRFNLSCQSRQGRLADPVAKIGNRLDFMRGISTPSPSGELIAHPVVGQQSHMLSGLAQANCLIHVPAEDEFLPEGTEVLIDLLNWNG